MQKLAVSPNAYYQEQYKNNGYLITTLPHACLIWGEDGEVMKAVSNLEEAERFTNGLSPA